MLATNLGVPFNSEADYDEKMETLHLKKKIIETKSITASAIVKEKNKGAIY
jgi:hypothetical protein